MTLEGRWLVCAPITAGLVQVPGSVFERCEKCHTMVYMAPSGARRLDEGDLDGVMCVECFVMNADENTVLAPRGDDQLEEVIEALTRRIHKDSN